MTESSPVRLGVAGLGGYAVKITDLVHEHGPTVSPPVRLVAACDPDLSTNAQRATELRGWGVNVYEDYQQMVSSPEVEAVWLPVPIPLHRPFMEAALEAGKPVMCEKPAAGAIDDLDAMIAARDRTQVPVAIGFQDVYDATTVPLKRRILAGEIGRVTHATVQACWPRTTAYFRRNNWAGRLRVDGAWVLDSPANNALSHQINIALFLLGPTLSESAAPTAIEAELYRAAEIENYDTLSARATLPGGTGGRTGTSTAGRSIPLLTLLTHACEQQHQPIVTIHGEQGRIVRTIPRITIHNEAGEEVIERERGMRRDMLERFARLVRRRADEDIAVASLEVARAHALVINGASEATPVVDVPERAVEVVDRDGSEVHAIRGIEAAIDQAAQQHQMLHETGALNFTRPAGHIDLTGYQHFSGPPASTT